MRIKFKEDEKGQKFPYVEIGNESHNRASFRLWVSARLLTKKDDSYELTFPVQNAKIHRTAKGSLVLRPEEGWTVHQIYVPCGFRGESSLEILEPEGLETFEYRSYSSPRGNLGISTGALVNTETDQTVKYSWDRSGRLYGGASHGISILMPDGTVKEFDEVPDGLESLKLEEEI